MRRGDANYTVPVAGIAFFTLAVLYLHDRQRQDGWMPALVAASVVGGALALLLSVAWFKYREFERKKWRMLPSSLAAGLLTTALLRHWTPAILAETAMYILLMLVPAFAVAFYRQRQHALLTARLRDEAERERMARELAEAQLRLLRAQIEPHFLFNTLGAVQQLAVHGAPRAAELTGNLIDFLRASMGEIRSDSVSLADEFGLVDAYLKVMQARLGERLRFSLRLPDVLGDTRIPSMIVLTLVENAIKHGIEPALRGGEVDVEAALEDGQLAIRVCDSGMGLGAPSDVTPEGGADHGATGLENIRRRLRLAYDDNARLTLHDADPGLVAKLCIPFRSV